MENTGTTLHPMQGIESLYTFLLLYILPNLHHLLELHEHMHEGSNSKDGVLYTAILHIATGLCFDRLTKKKE